MDVSMIDEDFAREMLRVKNFSEAFIDHLVDCGAKFAWFFHYMPVGSETVTDLLPNPEQRVLMYRKVLEYRSTKPIFTIDFQNDGEYVGGCIAGGRNYLHINANGDVEPCAFIHYSDSNIREKTQLEAFQSPECADHLCDKCRDYVACWAPEADRLWEERHR